MSKIFLKNINMFIFVLLNLRNYELKDWMVDIGCLLVCVLNNYLN